MKHIVLATFLEPFSSWDALYVDGGLVLDSDYITIQQFVEFASGGFTFDWGYVQNPEDVEDVPDDLSRLVLSKDEPSYH